MEPLDELRDLIRRHCGGGLCHSPLSGLTLMRSDATTAPMHGFYQPRFCVVAQGCKRVLLGERLFDYRAGDYFLVSVDLPVSGEIVEASPERPYLACSLDLEPATLAALLLELPEAAPDLPAVDGATAGMAMHGLTPELLDPLLRLLRLLDRPQEIPVLAPLARQEILFRLLLGRQGAMLRQIALAGSRISQVGRAIDWIQRHYAETLRIEALAEVAGMSASSLHRHFKAVTALSPLQFQKRIRLQEARRQLLARQASAGSIAFAVGYESQSQFSREYSRLFGAPPRRDAARLRQASVEEREEVAQPL
ncbi:AraC-type DNA-binding protein [Tistlia consotensis]|uniref:AraC-type DNA-binding protein n=1 Tax=Tistlia consotensis USBA 355 TaxID=560819 RepID=A0A1Y6CK00_9PROT|nr:AraC family transcriptional regulator [Tistlia consotensis]SMF69814.1 AraC-type DNA-binding protein [Tistlia consotensis USBA 355]SNS05273.1 AraC-type DNA-binding protein [Tistlia consotensis]